MKKNVEEVAKRVVANIKFEQDDREMALDPAWIGTAIDLIIELVKAFQKCKKTPEEAKEIIGNPTRLQRVRLSRITEKHLKDGFLVRRFGKKVEDAVQKTAKDLTADDIQQMYEEV